MFQKQNIPKKMILLNEDYYVRLLKKRLNKSVFNQLHQWLFEKFH